MNDRFPTREQIEKRAFEIFLERGCQKGSELANWIAAEKELTQLSRAPGKPPENIFPGDRSSFGPTFMLLDFFGLREQPFGMTPDPAYLYASATHRDALAALKFGIAENRGFFALIAQPGMGKTTLLYRLLEELHDTARTVLVSQTQCTSREFLEYILQELNVDTVEMGLVSMHGKLNEMLFAELLAGRRFVLVVDEAQNLDDTVLETVRMLSNFETHNAKLVQIILSGQPRLASKLAQPRLIQLRQRISVLSHLEPFTVAETAKYIAHRLMIAGHSGEPVFDSAAVNEIAVQSDGIPRNINNICFNSLLLSFQRGQRTVTAEVVKGVVKSLDLEALIPERMKSADPVPTAPALEVSVPEAVPVSAPKKIASPEPVREISKQRVDVPVVSATPDHVPAPVAVRVPPAAPASVPTTPSSPAKSETTSKASHVHIPVPPKTARASDAYISYEESRKLTLKRWQIRSVIVTAILLSAILALAILGRSQSNLGINSHVFEGTKGGFGSLMPSIQSDTGSSRYDAAPLETNNGEILTVAAGADQSIKDLTLRYVGHFDNDLSKQILALNPGLKDPDHLQAGQLIRIPLPPGAMKKANDTGDASASGNPETSSGVLGRISDLLHAGK
ncbi:MAG TPA: AAA family ATPase [Candidatus Saccharimonadales bacterium]|nr:AAA family ATPase [Candidatus Saccharimonadales bacterium]